jgi:hypothetical protein
MTWLSYGHMVQASWFVSMRTYSSLWRWKKMATESTVRPITNLYISATSHHYPSNKQAVLSMLVHRARILCDCESMHDELEFLRATLRQNGCCDWQIQWALSPLKRVTLAPEKPISVAFFTFVSTTFNCITRMLSRHNFRSVGLLLRTIPGFLWPVKDNLGLTVSRCVQHTLWMRSSLHWADQLFHWI